MHQDAIVKLHELHEALDGLRANLGAVQMAGLAAPELATAIHGHEERYALLERLSMLDLTAIRAERDGYARALGPHGDILLRTPYALGLPPELLRAKILGELCLLALGEHPAQGEESRVI